MKTYNFDEIVVRKGTNSIKHDALVQFFGTGDLIPVWVADTDFKTPDFIMKAVRKRMEHEVLGYTFRGDGFFEAIVRWVKRYHGWEIRKEWIVFSPGVVSALTVAVMAFTQPGEKVVIQPPVYFPFFDCVRGTRRVLTENPLEIRNNRYFFNLEDLKQKIDGSTRMLLLCNPHNPGGMVWKRSELEELADICIRNNMLVVSDEIHSDLIFDGHTHIPFGMLSEQAASHSMVCMAPSKTFNVAGLSTSFAIIPDSELRKNFEKMMHTLHIHLGNIAGNVALEAAYSSDGQWLKQMMGYVQENYRFLESYLASHLPKVKVMKPEATFLVWLDFREYGMNDSQLNKFLVEKARVGLNSGKRFGQGGDGFQRINIGCPRFVLRQALDRLAAAFQQWS